MDIHNVQAGEILRDFGVKTPPGGMEIEEITARSRRFNRAHSI